MTGRGRPRLSQHFLANPRTARRIAEAVRAPAGACVLEIGPGRGALTEPLLARGYRVTAVELDRKLGDHLDRRWGDRGDFRLIRADILSFALEPVAIEGGSWHVVGNLPYAITTPILFHMLAQADAAQIAEMVFMVQREVARRLVAEPGSKSRGALTVGVALAAEIEILFDVAPGEFRPPPRVRSSVVRLTPSDRWGLGPVRRERVRWVVRRLFGQRRKQLQKLLRTLPPWALDPASVSRIGEEAGIDLRQRPEMLGVEEWLRLEESLARAGFSTLAG